MPTENSQIAKTLALAELNAYFANFRLPFTLQQVQSFNRVYERLYPSLNEEEKPRLDAWAALVRGARPPRGAAKDAVHRFTARRGTEGFFGVCWRLEFGVPLENCVDSLL